MTDDRLLYLLPMDYKRFCNLTDKEREDWEELKEYIGEYTRYCSHCLEILDELKDLYGRLKKGYNKSRIELLLNSCIDFFGLKARGVNKKFEILSWRIKCMTPAPMINCTNYSKIERLYNLLYSFYTYNFK